VALLVQLTLNTLYFNENSRHAPRIWRSGACDGTGTGHGFTKEAFIACHFRHEKAKLASGKFDGWF